MYRGMHEMSYMNTNRASLIFICESSSLSPSKDVSAVDADFSSSQELDLGLVEKSAMAGCIQSKSLPSLKALAACIQSSQSSIDSNEASASSLELLGCLAIERLSPMKEKSPVYDMIEIKSSGNSTPLSSHRQHLHQGHSRRQQQQQQHHHHHRREYDQIKNAIQYPFSTLNRSEELSPESMYDSDNGLKPKRKRANSQQLASLQSVFEMNPFPSTEARAALGKRLGMHPRSVQIWFQNKRQALKQKIE